MFVYSKHPREEVKNHLISNTFWNILSPNDSRKNVSISEGNTHIHQCTCPHGSSLRISKGVGSRAGS